MGLEFTYVVSVEEPRSLPEELNGDTGGSDRIKTQRCKAVSKIVIFPEYLPIGIHASGWAEAQQFYAIEAVSQPTDVIPVPVGK